MKVMKGAKVAMPIQAPMVGVATEVMASVEATAGMVETLQAPGRVVPGVQGTQADPAVAGETIAAPGGRADTPRVEECKEGRVARVVTMGELEAMEACPMPVRVATEGPVEKGVLVSQEAAVEMADLAALDT